MATSKNAAVSCAASGNIIQACPLPTSEKINETSPGHYSEILIRLVGFDERQTATLVKGKPLEYAGELYSEEHGRKFTTERAGFQVLKDPTDGTKLVLAIDRKPIAEWFKEQFEKLRQNIRRPIQPQRKGKGFKL